MNEINLLPDEYIKTARKKPKRTLVMGLSLAVVALLILLSASFIGRYQEIRTAIDHINELYNESFRPLLEREKELRATEREISEKYSLYLELEEHKTIMSEILLEIAQLTPDNVQIVYIDVGNDKNAVIRGRAPSDRVVANFMASLGKSENLLNINLDHITSEAGRGDDGLFTFQLTFFLKEKGEM
ncbi:MAG TPA: PilN domain-containing protein [Tepidanaerobacteraceae bacterium]|nr:PilN domain-containing protein [Tepidanaerobacteraceae bacterium]HQE06532.1 PilN domain-containing protein [Tepidanaerobacteraceae bacterium]